MKVCSMCFEPNESSADYCKECGAPLKTGTEGSDPEVYTDLARANLLRTRGDMKGANDVCLGILRKFPNNATAHSLLGDIAADQDDLEQAKTWYEMALDLVPNSPHVRKKLDAVVLRIKSKESTEAAELIGIHQGQPKTWPYVVLVAATVIAVGAGAYVFGRFGPARVDKSNTTIQTPVSLGQDQIPTKSVEPPATTDSGDSHADEPVATMPSTPANTDAALLQALQSKSTEKLPYVGVIEDPRGPSAVITVRQLPEPPQLTATKAGLEFFRLYPAYAKVSIRIQGDPEIVFVADLTKEAAKTAEAALAGGDTMESQAQVMLSQTWTPPHQDVQTTAGGPQ